MTYEFWIPMATAIIAPIISYLGARHTAKIELKKTIETHNAEMKMLREAQEHELKKITEQTKHDIEKLNAEFDKQAEIYERNSATDITNNLAENVVKEMMNGNTEVLSSLVGLQEFVNKLK